MVVFWDLEGDRVRFEDNNVIRIRCLGGRGTVGGMKGRGRRLIIVSNFSCFFVIRIYIFVFRDVVRI